MPKVSTKSKSRPNLECNRQGIEKISDFLSSSLEAWRAYVINEDVELTLRLRILCKYWTDGGLASGDAVII